MRGGEATILFFATLGLVLLACAVVIAWRLRRLSAQRADAELRAAAAFEEIHRLTKELRQRSGEEDAPHPDLPLGVRLQRQYPGPAGRRPDPS
jgi:type VI protein secretion system component VasK